MGLIELNLIVPSGRRFSSKVGLIELNLIVPMRQIESRCLATPISITFHYLYIGPELMMFKLKGPIQMA